MLSSFWGLSNTNHDKNSVLSEDETEWLTENEDELADKLLTQFPTYGSAQPTPDWLLEGDDTTATDAPEETVLQEHLLLPMEELHYTGGTVTSPTATTRQHQQQQTSPVA